MNIYPKELLTHPIPLVGLTGNPETQISIQKKFENKFNFVSFTDIRPHKRTSIQELDNYIPGGIISGNWLIKHFYTYPVVVVSCHQFDFLNTKKSEKDILDQLSHLNECLKLRNFKSIILLVLQNAPSGFSEVIEEKITFLKRKGDFENKKGTFLIFPQNFPNPYYSRIESAIRNYANRIHKEEIRKIKKYQDILNRKTQNTLIARHLFKCGFYSECRIDFKNAIKYYQKSYQEVKEMINKKEMLTEIKTVLEVLNIKITRLHFVNKNFVEGIEEFHKHINFVRRINSEDSERDFESYASISQQYLSFAELLEENISRQSGIQPKITKNIGLYYQLAAEYAMKRQRAVEELLVKYEDQLSRVEKNFHTSQTFHMHLLDFPKLNFIGQPNLQFGFLQELSAEKNFRHSSQILHLLQKAYHHYSDQENSERLLISLQSKIAQQHLSKAEYDLAKEKFIQIASNFRKIQWDSLLIPQLLNLMECSIQTADQKLFVDTVLELLIPEFKHSLAQRIEYHEKFFSALYEPHSIFNKTFLPQELIFEMKLDTPFYSLIETRTHFTTTKAYQNDTLIYKCRFISHFPRKIICSQIEILFNIQKFDISLDRIQTLTHTESENSEIVLLPEQPKTFRFSFKAKTPSIIQCISVKLGLQNTKLTESEKNFVFFRWNPFEIFQKESFHPAKHPSRPIVHIQRPRAQMEIVAKMQTPPFVFEYFPIHLRLLSHSDHIISGNLIPKFIRPLGKCSIHYQSPTNNINSTSISLPEILPQKEYSIVLFAKCNKESEHVIRVCADYTTANLYQTSIQSDFVLDFQSPFKMDLKFFGTEIPSITTISRLSSSLGPVLNETPSLIINRPFFLDSCLVIDTHIPLKISNFNFVPNSGFRKIFGNSIPDEIINNPDLIQQNNCFSNLFSVLPSQEDSLQIGKFVEIGFVQICFSRKLFSFQKIQEDLGQFAKEWKEEDFVTKLLFKIPSAVVIKKDVLITFDPPQEARVGETLQCKLVIQNCSSFFHFISVEIEKNENFLFSGVSSINVDILPNENKTISYNFIPVFQGLIMFPLIKVTEFLENGSSQVFPEMSKPNYVFVYPPLGLDN
ncbi:trafficking protein particle complex subunit 11 [Anaeramoeba ignava]|uniref:Trafficking protein particle complex subunit 11 n=1 Tax=Anaeramoeba ignava TaxID=1746090 RepID=A0A9Q0RA61_ANAIG|nr:trafficking protein particle complex subunit 11 [Anaeramoeba ignava]